MSSFFQPAAGAKPRIVGWAIWLQWTALLLGPLHLWLERPWHPAHPTAAQARALARLPAGAMLGIVLQFAVLKWSVLAWLIFMIARGQDWARFTRLFLFLAGLLSLVSPWLRPTRVHSSAGMIGLVQHLLPAVSLCMLYTRAANEWFRPVPPPLPPVIPV